MEPTILLSMAAYSFASSISPGPVNIVALASGIRYGFRRSFPHVTGATAGFTTLLIMIGYGLNELVDRVPHTVTVVKLAGAAFLIYMSYKLAVDRGEVDTESGSGAPSVYQGALMQWLNPKAWLASIAGMGLFAADGAIGGVLIFAGVYFVVCYVSIACWAAAGAFLREQVHNSAHVRLLNRALAALLALSAFYLIWTGA